MLFKQIEYFQSVVESGNFYLAAEKCCISQSAISQQIKKLEDELGAKLLDRHNRTFSLTKAGEHFYRKSLVITEDVSRMIRETRRIADDSGAVLRLGYYEGYVRQRTFRGGSGIFSEISHCGYTDNYRKS